MKSSNIVVRPCRYDEVEKIIALHQEIKVDLEYRGREAFFDNVKEDLWSSLMRDPSFIMGVFEQDTEELLGYCVCQWLYDDELTSERYMIAFDLPIRARPFMWLLKSIAVKPDIWNHKIGSLLLISVICYLSNRGNEQYLVGKLHPEHEKGIHILKKYNPFYSPVFEVQTSNGKVPRTRFCVRI